MNLGEKLRQAIDKLRLSGSLDAEAVKEAVKEIQRALISADVEVSLVLELSKRIESQAFAELPKGMTRREFIIKLTYDSLAELLGAGEGKAPEKPEKILLLGLFGQGKTTQPFELQLSHQGSINLFRRQQFHLDQQFPRPTLSAQHLFH